MQSGALDQRTYAEAMAWTLKLAVRAVLQGVGEMPSDKTPTAGEMLAAAQAMATSAMIGLGRSDWSYTGAARTDEPGEDDADAFDADATDDDLPF